MLSSNIKVRILHADANWISLQLLPRTGSPSEPIRLHRALCASLMQFGAEQALRVQDEVVNPSLFIPDMNSVLNVEAEVLG